eukprot:Protomagalhaensia_sp_Gyna_25__1048@NODE_1505_length_1776_cov_5662_723661_g1220_i0_p1_GENE_NODE_1505_length_1776_cov_5662_723661_g1220_i0NODE_1505_length_1776_cov_5662_723661_g1220_i0_p1_ORF_typecomplete_len446_score66_38Glyco_hydro_18/PF00704_28/1_3e12DUF4849/PF16141_5/0_016_NODE_1505_length_1776_cov_5662_723661_g1220_i0551392
MKWPVLSLLSIAAAKRNAYIYVMNGNLGNAAAVEDYFLALARAGTTHLMSSFMVPGQAGFTDGLADTVAVWSRLSPADQTSIVNKLHNAGSELLLVSAGGSYGTIYLGYDPANWADIVCGHAKANAYDGVDMDLENFAPYQANQFVEWAIAATQRCHTYVKEVTHAPQTPYFHSAWGSAYNRLVDYVDLLLVQFYNQGAAAHATYETTFVKDSNWASWKDLAADHPSQKHKFVVGKYVYPGFGGSGMFTPAQFAEAVERAERELGYDAGIMIWRAPQPGETALYNQFINTDLPAMAGLNSEPAPTQPPVIPTEPPAPTVPPVVPTAAPTAAPTVAPPVPTNPPVVPTNPPVLPTNPPVLPTNPPVVPTEPPVVPTQPPVVPPPTSPLEYCKANIDCPSNPVWAQDCIAKCDWYNTWPIYCSANYLDAEALLACVMKMHPYCIRKA